MNPAIVPQVSLPDSGVDLIKGVPTAGPIGLALRFFTERTSVVILP